MTPTEEQALAIAWASRFAWCAAKAQWKLIATTPGYEAHRSTWRRRFGKTMINAAIAFQFADQALDEICADLERETARLRSERNRFR